MNYPDGEKIKVGDKIELWDGCEGIVVCSISESNYTNDYTEKDWSYLKEGILVETNLAGLIHFTEVEDSFKLIKNN